MSIYKYSVVEAEGEKWGKSQRHDVNCSYKDLSQVLGAIKYKSITQAELMLNEAIELKKAIPFRKFAKGMGHRSELGGKRGKYPKKECRIALEMLENARANAVQKGLDESALYVKHAAAFKQNVLKRYRKYFANSRTLGYGKQALWGNYVTCRAEMVVAEKPEAQGKRVKKAGEAPKAGKAGQQAKAEKKQDAKPAKQPALQAGEAKHAKDEPHNAKAPESHAGHEGHAHEAHSPAREQHGKNPEAKA